MALLDRWRRGYNAFITEEETRTDEPLPEYNAGYVNAADIRPDRAPMKLSNERSIIASIYNRLSIDAASIDIKHVRLDDKGRYLDDVQSGLNNCLSLEANLDQSARALRQDYYRTMFEEGVVALVPVDTDISLRGEASFDILTLRVGSIIKWWPDKVQLSVYNERSGKREKVTLLKTQVAIVENPFYAVMNQSNSTLQRLIRKLTLLDMVDEASASGKLDLIIQLPYVIKSEMRQQQAEQRRSDLEMQLKGSKYGIGYIDGTEKITQLNRPVDNNFMAQVTVLTDMLYSELGMTKEVMNLTASEETMLKYWNSTIEPIVDATVEELRRKFLTKTARTQRQSVVYFRDPFKLMPIANIADIADKLTRNEILTSNEIRQKLGFQPSQEPKADQLVNPNMPQVDTGVAPADPAAPVDGEDEPVDGEDAEMADDDPEAIMNGAFDDMDSQLDEIFASLGVDENEL